MASAGVEDQNQTSRMVVVCVDDSKHCKRAFNWYLRQVHRDGDVVGIVHIHVPPNIPRLGLYGGGYAAMEIYKELQKLLQASIIASKKIVAKYKNICTDKGVKCQVFVESVDSSVGNTIIKIAKKNKALIIVIGQRGLGIVRRTLMGGVSSYVLRHSNMPVLVVP